MAGMRAGQVDASSAGEAAAEEVTWDSWAGQVPTRSLGHTVLGLGGWRCGAVSCTSVETWLTACLCVCVRVCACAHVYHHTYHGIGWKHCYYYHCFLQLQAPFHVAVYWLPFLFY